MAITLYQHHLPDEVRVGRYLAPPVHADDEVVVCDGYYPSSEIYCRAYHFLRRWLHVFVTFGPSFARHADHYEGFAFAFNCDITTPHHRVGDSLYTTDLCVDVLVNPAGTGSVVKDREEFEAMYAAGQFGRLWYQAALAETARLEELVKRGQFVHFLESALPFPTTAAPHEISEMTVHHLGDVGFVYHPAYPRYA